VRADAEAQAMKLRLQRLADPHDAKTMSMTVESATWPELFDEFVRFLHAASFSIDKKQLIEWAEDTTVAR
jgi:hypothetical protein